MNLDKKIWILFGLFLFLQLFMFKIIYNNEFKKKEEKEEHNN